MLKISLNGLKANNEYLYYYLLGCLKGVGREKDGFIEARISKKPFMSGLNANAFDLPDIFIVGCPKDELEVFPVVEPYKTCCKLGCLDVCGFFADDDFIVDNTNRVDGFLLDGSTSKPCNDIESNSLRFKGSNIIDFLGDLYIGSQEYMSHNYAHFLKMLGHEQRIPRCKFVKMTKDAITPSKVRHSDVGYDLTIIGVQKWLNSVTSLYNTGIKIGIPTGYYAEIVPRSSLSKSGYMLANSIGIIDPSYTGELLVALTKVDPSAQDIQFPFKCCQLIFKRQEVICFDEVEDLEVTDRGAGGFGSTDEKNHA